MGGSRSTAPDRPTSSSTSDEEQMRVTCIPYQGWAGGPTIRIQKHAHTGRMTPGPEFPAEKAMSSSPPSAGWRVGGERARRRVSAHRRCAPGRDPTPHRPKLHPGGCIPASTTRVFATGAKAAVLPVLTAIPVDELPQIAGEAAFRAWFERQLEAVAAAILRLNPPAVRPGTHPGCK